jgi:hypothetical protein
VPVLEGAGRIARLILSREKEASLPHWRTCETGFATRLYGRTTVLLWFSEVRIIEPLKSTALSVDTVGDAIADAYARRVLAVCVKKAKAVKDISHETGLPLPTAYRQVNHLAEVGLLVVERSAMTPDGKKYDLYRSRVKSARIEVDGSGERVTWEPNEATEERLSSMWDSLRSHARRP